MSRLLLTALFFEAGLVLLIVPWSEYWDTNYFVQALPMVRDFLANDFVRGAVSGLGLVNLLAALGEIWSFFTARRASEPLVSISRSPATEE